MPKNRVEELEAEVAQLQSTVSGLTDELVEAKERIRVLEAELDADAPTRVPDRRESDADESASGTAEEADPDDVAAAADEAGEADEDEAQDSGVDDIIVA